MPLLMLLVYCNQGRPKDRHSEPLKPGNKPIKNKNKREEVEGAAVLW